MAAQLDILLVEDNKQDAELTVRALRKHNLGDRVQLARDGAEALDFIFAKEPYKMRAVLHTPKVILLDLKLPKVDGLEVLRRLKEDSRTRTIPVVVLTSSKQQRDILESYKLGVNSYITKPIQYEEFLSTMSELGLYWMIMNTPPA